MRLVLRQGNVLDADADALVLPVDGAARGMEGNVARQLQRRWGDAWEAIESELAFPIPLGTAAAVEARPPVRFRYVFVASILGHLENDAAAGYVRGALGAVLARSRSLGLHTIASPLLKGGWRLSASAAFRAMVDAVDAHRDDAARLEVHSLVPEHHEYLVELARSFGIRDPAHDGST